ncbi:uncharacterized protein LOC128197546 [Vigna angularis]|nr:uncharacterized protein LOC128197546 [Vigna angularis]
MASRPSSPPSPVRSDVSNLVRVMESFVVAMQQQNASLMQHNTMALQQLKAARVSAEAQQRQYVELMNGGARISTDHFYIPPTPIHEWSLENFLQHHPAKFCGNTSADEADQWFRDMERIFNAKNCPEENRLAYTEYLLSGEASHWWTSTRTLLERSGTPITWNLFKKKFYAEYSLDSVRFTKEVEFLQLVQGGMSVTEYADKFKHLIRFHTLDMDEEWQCRKFENGLRGDIKLLVKGLCIKEFPTLVERAKVLEKTKNEVQNQQRQPQRIGGPSGSKFSHGDKRKPYSKPPFQAIKGPSFHPSGQVGQSSVVKCFRCGGPHYKSVCPQLVGPMKCYTCGKEGHFARNCPTSKGSRLQLPTNQPQQMADTKPQAVGRVYAMTGAEATGPGNLIIGNCLLFGKACCVLFDSGATHSFVSDDCVRKLGLTVSELQYDLIVSTPASGLVKTSLACTRCPIVVEGRQFRVNLICLPLQGLEIIFGMDWLTSNHILLDCGAKRLLFPQEEESRILSSGKLWREVQEGSCCFIVLTHMEVN